MLGCAATLLQATVAPLSVSSLRNDMMRAFFFPLPPLSLSLFRLRGLASLLPYPLPPLLPPSDDTLFSPAQLSSPSVPLSSLACCLVPPRFNPLSFLAVKVTCTRPRGSKAAGRVDRACESKGERARRYPPSRFVRSPLSFVGVTCVSFLRYLIRLPPLLDWAPDRLPARCCRKN